jgi:trimethylamine--corrinoid protein Co-methyltransferase
MQNLKILTSNEIQKIHQATLEILERIGIALTDPQGVDILTAAGATCSKGRIFLPSELVLQSVEKCPRHITMKGRNRKFETLGGGRLGWHNLGGARDVYEPQTNSKRPAKVKDVQDATRLLDALQAVTAITPFFTPLDVPGPVMSLSMYRHTIPYTTKPIHGPGVQNAAEVDYILRMAEVVSTPSEALTLSVSPISPLRFPDQAVQAMIKIAQAGVPFGSLPCPTAGTTAPITLAGAIAQQNAEILASIVLTQLVRPGLPVFYCGRLSMMEPRTGISVWGGVEMGLASAATVQVAHFYGLPVNVYGFSTNSHHFDIQNGYERALNALLPALAGADELSGIGEMEAGVMGSYAQMVLDAEIAGSVNRSLQGITVNDDTLGVEVIASVINEAGNFLLETHTSKFLRKGEMYITRLSERESWETWIKNGYPDMASRAEQWVKRIFGEQEAPPLESFQEMELDEILKIATKELNY